MFSSCLPVKCDLFVLPTNVPSQHIHPVSLGFRRLSNFFMCLLYNGARVLVNCLFPFVKSMATTNYSPQKLSPFKSTERGHFGLIAGTIHIPSSVFRDPGTLRGTLHGKGRRRGAGGEAARYKDMKRVTRASKRSRRNAATWRPASGICPDPSVILGTASPIMTDLLQSFS